MNRILNYFYTFVVAIAGYYLFAIKIKVQDLGYQLSSINSQVQKEQSDLNILKAEFAYLSSPKRLKSFVDNHLMLSDISANQISKDPLLREDVQISTAPGNVKHDIHLITKKISWRYKTYGKTGMQTVNYKGQ
ncbi:MAG: hypothetical protein V4485_03360 [Pseudomonadota bacterium]